MADRDKIIQSLEHCLNTGRRPWMQDIRDAVELLKAQESRVMSPEEVRALNLDDVIYIECYPTKDIFSAIVIAVRPKLLDIPIGVVQFRRGAGYNGIFNAELGCYGKTWRCWTSRPTEAQREATLWTNEQGD